MIWKEENGEFPSDDDQTSAVVLILETSDPPVASLNGLTPDLHV